MIYVIKSDLFPPYGMGVFIAINNILTFFSRGRGKFPFVRGSRGFVRGGRGQRWMSGRGYSSKDYPDDYRRQR
jgi:hypothetical protein